MPYYLNRLCGLRVLLVTLGLAILTGCLANYGKLKIDRTVEQSFRNHEMLDDYRYYYSGRENKPSAIIGIDPNFELVASKFWTAIEASRFSTMVDRMDPEYGFLYGAYILAPDGREAGVWYSWVSNFTAQFENNRIVVFSPEPYADVDRGSGLQDRF